MEPIFSSNNYAVKIMLWCVIPLSNYSKHDDVDPLFFLFL